MLPLQQAYETREAIIEYLKATFNFKEKEISDAFYKFIQNEKYGISHEPYISLKTPFTSAESDGRDLLDVVPGYMLYKHQYLSFSRLSTKKEHNPQPTLLTTGTGSGKTECFLYPLLDYCYHWRKNHPNKEGIKAIILYPMNALASDQAKRLAEAIYADERLRGNVTAGLFIGEGKDREKKYPIMMGEHNIIEDREQILATPPDIILTNFKMLDYALMKNNYACIWEHNFADSSMLQFLVLDELHTYDGAQGTDVANLIRRLKLKLKLQEGMLCPIGTSATIGSGPNASKLLRNYASDVFGEYFDEESVIVEDRIKVEGFTHDADNNFIPSIDTLNDTKFRLDDNYDIYIERQTKLWGLQNDGLAVGLSKLTIIRDITNITYDSYITVSDLIVKLADINEQFRSIQETRYKNVEFPRLAVLNSLFALIAAAKKGTKPQFPFLYLQVQLWLRELSGFLRVVSNEIKFTWKKDIDKTEKDQRALPAYFCRECGASGWIGYKTKNSQCLETDPGKTSMKFIDNDENCYLISLYSSDHFPIDEYKGEVYDWWIDPSDLHIYQNQGEESDNRVHVLAIRKVEAGKKNKNPKFKEICPSCCSENSLAIIGTKVATLASVAISQVMSSDLDNENESSRKILAFTNSVQDAAHQAGFFEARNYRFSFRNALQNCIRKLADDGRLPISLEDLEKEFVVFWKEKCHFSENQEDYVYRFFPPDRLGDIDLDNNYRQGKNGYQKKFIEQLDLRLGWEITSEFGLNARIGRTLEKSGASATFFDENKLREVFELMKPWLASVKLDRITRNHFIQFLNGLLHRMRIRGAVDHPFLTKFREEESNTFNLSNIKGSPYFLCYRFGKKSRYPKVITTQRLSSSRDILDSTFVNPRTTNWYKHYFLKCFTKDLSINEMLMDDIPDSLYNDFFSKLFETLSQVGILKQSEREKEQNYCISPSAIFISEKVKHIGCYKCTSVMCVAEQDEISENTPCIDFKCPGQYNDIKREEIQRYYYNVYNRALSPRIYAHEHTGILDRKKRESIEYQFKSNESKNNINAMVATSTLEMGIDIGDLNVAVNTSIPPMPSNFIQRVGRAGRKSGASLIVDFARNEYHDLFYYAEPKEMMQGKINTPGCYLSAVDILRRHYFAFCLDTWTGLDPENNIIPSRVFMLPIATYETNDCSFYNRIISYIIENGKELEVLFRSQYKIEQEEALDSLSSMLRDGMFVNLIKKEFKKLYNTFMGMTERINDISQTIKSSGWAETDEERIELELQKSILFKTRRTLVNQQVLEFMTNSGLLPNYAFPEQGVTLDATIIHRPPVNDKQSKYIIQEIEVQRSASSALSELAPGNHFYAQKYKMNVSGLSTLNWSSGDRETLVPMRFCSKCDHIEIESADHEQTCPICGDQDFGTPVNVHNFVRMDVVRSSDKKEDAVTGDNSDDRESNYYLISKHFIFDGSINASGLRTIPFGIEYCKSVDVIDVNLGDSEQRDARDLQINEREHVPVKGFVTCRYCGKSTSKSHDLNVTDPKELHYSFCKHKDQAYKDKSDEYFEEVYLYHKFHTEAIKVLLPVQEVDTEATTDMFAAGIGLGLRDYFEGNPDHIKIEKYKTYNDKTHRFDRYIILYDTIPGGTGYLAQICNPTEFEKILQNAWERIHTCKCKEEGKDGCYHCIFTYSNQRIQDKLSRKRADELFRKILDNCYDEKNGTSNWEQIGKLGILSQDGGMEESELEKRFIYAIQNYVQQDNQADGTHSWSFEKDDLSYRQQYKLSYDDGSNLISYVIIPQYVLNKSKGVEFYTEPDFLIRPVMMKHNDGHQWNEVAFDHLRSIAIYMDGYSYHASSQHNVFNKDFRKRQSIEASDRYMSYTLSWNDMNLFEDKENNKDSVFERHQNSILQKLPPNPWTSQHNSMLRLFYLLANLWQTKKIKDELLMYVVGLQPALNSSFELFPSQPWASLKVTIDMANKQLKTQFNVPENFQTDEGLPEKQWQDFWRVYDLISMYQGIEVLNTNAADIDEDAEFERIASAFDDELHDIVIQLLKQGIEFNHTAGVGIFDESGRKVCEADLVSEQYKFVFFSDDDEAATAAGYSVYDPETFNIEAIKK